METIKLTGQEFDGLPEYSCTLPTGTTLGKRWKRNVNFRRPRAVVPLYRNDAGTFGIVLMLEWPDEWTMGEYVPPESIPMSEDDRKRYADTKDVVGIRWHRIEVVG